MKYGRACAVLVVLFCLGIVCRGVWLLILDTAPLPSPQKSSFHFPRGSRIYAAIRDIPYLPVHYQHDSSFQKVGLNWFKNIDRPADITTVLSPLTAEKMIIYFSRVGDNYVYAFSAVPSTRNKIVNFEWEPRLVEDGTLMLMPVYVPALKGMGIGIIVLGLVCVAIWLFVLRERCRATKQVNTV